VTDTIELTDIFLRLVGAFYAFAGVVATRAGMMSHFLDRALAAITMKKPSRVETAQTAWLLVSSALVLLGGVLLLAGLAPALVVFAASAAGQAAYIFVVAPRFFDRDDPPDTRGRQQTTNAFVLYLAATAFIGWAWWRGRLTPLGEATAFELGAVGAALLLYAWYVARTMWWTPRKSSAGVWGSSPNDDDVDPEPYVPTRPLHTSQRIKLMADYGCDPLWAMDDDIYGCFPPEELDLPESLSADINAWAARFETAFDPNDPTVGWSEEEALAHEADGRRLAVLIKRERPELTVFAFTSAIGVIEVNADEPV
jgi:hypothetical protein